MRNHQPIEVILSQPRGMCAGVRRAIEILEMVVEIYGHERRICVLHEIVHNSYVIGSFRKKSVEFVHTLNEVPDGAVLVFSAHGVAQGVRRSAAQRGLLVIDATCPLVTKVHLEIQRYDKKGYQVILIGHKGHQEVEGSMGQVSNPLILVQNAQEARDVEVQNAEMLAYATQTTLSMCDTLEIIKILQSRFPKIVGPGLNDVCYATQNRQMAVRVLAKMVDLLLVVGSSNSSNSSKLLELARSICTQSFLVESYENIDLGWLKGVKKIGITAGASAPETLVQQIIDHLRLYIPTKVSAMDGRAENTIFKLPAIGSCNTSG